MADIPLSTLTGSGGNFKTVDMSSAEVTTLVSVTVTAQSNERIIVTQLTPLTSTNAVSGTDFNLTLGGVTAISGRILSNAYAVPSNNGSFVVMPSTTNSIGGGNGVLVGGLGEDMVFTRMTGVTSYGIRWAIEELV